MESCPIPLDIDQVLAASDGILFQAIAQPQFNLSKKLPFGHDLHWLREFSGGLLQGTAGVRVDASGEASVGAQFRGDFQISVSKRTREAGAKLNLRVRSASEGSISARVTAQAELHGSNDGLLRALQGIHGLQWLRALLTDSGSPRWLGIAQETGVRGEVLDRLLDKWKTLTGSAEAVIWNVAQSPEPAGLDDLLGDERLSTALVRLAELSRVQLDPQQLCAWARERLAAMLTDSLPWDKLRAAINRQSGNLLEKTLGTELALLVSAKDSTLIDVTVPGDLQGIRTIQRIAAGDLSFLTDDAPCPMEIGKCAFTHEAFRSRYIELRLPFLGRRRWTETLTAIVNAEVVHDASGKLAIYTTTAKDEQMESTGAVSTMLFTGSFAARSGEPLDDTATLSYSSTRVLPPGHDLSAWNQVLQAYGLPPMPPPTSASQVTLTVSIPGNVLNAWAESPHSRDETYFSVMSRVSRAVQRFARVWIPAFYLGSVERYKQIAPVSSLLVYQCSAPYTTRRRCALSYDVMDTESVMRAAESASAKLPAVLSSIHSHLSCAGMPDIAAFYDPIDSRYMIGSVLAARRNLSALLSGDAFFVEEMLHLADCARELRQLSRSDPHAAARRLERYSTELVKAFHSKLRRLYAGEDFVAMGPLLLIEATAALAGCQLGAIPVQATLSVARDGEMACWRGGTVRDGGFSSDSMTE